MRAMHKDTSTWPQGPDARPERSTQPQILVIGGASLDLLHFGGQTVTSAGGAGLYTAAAVGRSGGSAAMLAPRPDPVPESLRPALGRMHWIGPQVPPDQLPHFEIAHYGDGRAELLQAAWGAEARLGPADLPTDLSRFALVHIAAVGPVQRQLAFLQACRQRGAPRVSAGTYGRAVFGETEAARTLFQQADLFFMNENEARGLFGDPEKAATTPGKLLFVTLGRRGAQVYQGSHGTDVPGVPAEELDPTGAGDTFCGATLAGLARGEHPIMAARRGVALAARMIGAVGPAALWQDGAPPDYPADPRVVLNPQQISRVAVLVAGLPEVEPFAFTGPSFPPAGHPKALDYFFTATLQQFGFWTADGGRYSRPLLAPLGGAVHKGSDYLWHAWLRPLDRDPDFYHPPRQAGIAQEDLTALFRADDGSDPMPALDLRLAQARSYGHDLLALAATPQDLLGQANASATPRGALLAALDHVGGYKEDPLRKKSGLLALVLSQRPERFLRVVPGEPVPPVIDYHLMRSCLRIGLLDVADPALARALAERRVLSPADEWAVRLAAYAAVEQVVARSGQPMGAVDWFFFNARRRCPEMTPPDCQRCAVDPVCGHRKELFQPVLRTVFY
jgi:ribokinase